MNAKLDLKEITLLAMTSIKIPETIHALEFSSKYINYAAIKLITHEKPADIPDNIEYCYIPYIKNIDDYSYKMIYMLSSYIDTKYVLIVQYDGFVINPASWRDEFLDYDYIGAPFPLPIDSFSYRDHCGQIIRVGNGGFSLRSKFLIDLPNVLGLEWRPYHGFYSEDGFICAMNRHIYEANGCKFAPLEIAKYFSHETEIPEIRNIEPFGFHNNYLIADALRRRKY